MAERQGIEIDYCPKCRGVWLDRGELDKLIDRATTAATPPQPQQAPYPSQSPYPPSRQHESDDYRRGYKRKRKGLLGEIFDFD